MGVMLKVEIIERRIQTYQRELQTEAQLKIANWNNPASMIAGERVSKSESREDRHD
jgi:hypothetical protein